MALIHLPVDKIVLVSLFMFYMKIKLKYKKENIGTLYGGLLDFQ